MSTASPFLRSFLMACGLLAVVACGDDADDPQAGDSGVDSGPDVGHQHSDASAADASVDAAPDPSCAATISLQDFKLVPADPVVTSGTLTLCARNDGRSQHDLALRGGDGTALGKTATLSPGELGRFDVTLSAGSFVIFCSLPGHESLGMKGTLTAR